MCLAFSQKEALSGVLVRMGIETTGVDALPTRMATIEAVILTDAGKNVTVLTMIAALQ